MITASFCSRPFPGDRGSQHREADSCVQALARCRYSVLNLAGPFSQKMASMYITAVVITGKSNSDGPVVLSICGNGIEIQNVPELKEKEVSETINYIRGKYGVNSAVLGIGPAGEHMLPLASVFATYPEGVPVYNCARGGMGDIFGSKGLKAIAVTTKSHFLAKVFDHEKLRESSKKLARIIIDHPICGGALPAYGSITLMKMMKTAGIALPETMSLPAR